MMLHEFVDEGRLGANGYCFGGLMILELARTGGRDDVSLRCLTTSRKPLCTSTYYRE